jgi:hypothetical protein
MSILIFTCFNRQQNVNETTRTSLAVVRVNEALKAFEVCAYVSPYDWQGFLTLFRETVRERYHLLL